MAQPAAPPAVDKLALIELLRQGDFSALDARLSAYQEAFEAGLISDELVGYAFDTFQNSDPELESHLDAWVNAHPASYAARMARSIYYSHLAGVSRGYQYYVDTPRQRRATQNKYVVVATSDAEKAIELRPSLSIAYAQTAIWATHRVGTRERLDFIARALDQAPYSIILREQFLLHTAAWRGGKPGRFEAALEHLREGMPAGMSSEVLEAIGRYARAVALSNAGRRTDAIAVLDRAIAARDSAKYQLKKARILLELRRVPEALDAFEQGLKLEPRNNLLLGYRATALLNQGKPRAAVADWTSILEFDPFNPHFLRSRGWVRSKYLSEHDAALADLNKALVHGHFDPMIYLFRSHVLDWINPDDRDAVIADVTRALELDPNSLAITWSYAVAVTIGAGTTCGDQIDRAIRAMTRYLELCERMSDCHPPYSMTAREEITGLEQKRAECFG